MKQSEKNKQGLFLVLFITENGSYQSNCYQKDNDGNASNAPITLRKGCCKENG